MPAAEDKNYYRQLRAMPFGNQYTLDTAWEILSCEDLGGDDVPDLLVINLAANDYVGHHFGPYSLEVEDMFYRTDRMLSQWVKRLSERLEPGSWVVALTSDHGVAPIPDYAAQLGLAAARDPAGPLDQVRERLESHLREKPGVEAGEPRLVLEVESNQVFLNARHSELAGARFTVAQRCVRDWLLAEASAAAMTREQLLAGGLQDRLQRMFHHAFHPARSGDVLYIQRPYQFYPGRYCTSHGSPWGYDTHVPLMLLGGGIESGCYDRPVHPGDLAPTLARLLDVDPPAACQHQPLQEALR
jgi:arylsulfatase A-like enzyme